MRKLINLIESVQAEQLDEGAADKLKGAIIGAAITFAAVNTDLDKVFVEPVKDAIEQFKATDKQTTDSVAVVDPDNKSILNNWVEKYQKWQEVNKQHAIVDKDNKERAKQDRKNIEIKKEKRDAAVAKFKREKYQPQARTLFNVVQWSSNKSNEFMYEATFIIKIRNKNEYVSIKDPIIGCDFLSETDTVLKTSYETLYKSINPGDYLETEVTFSFPFSQKVKLAKSARCSLKSVEYHKTLREPNRDHTSYTVY